MRAEKPHCEVHIFDPTILPAWDGKWNYHHVGLGGEDNNKAHGHTGSKSTVFSVKTLRTIMRTLGHSFVDVLKFDIEGSEFQFARSMKGQWQSLPVGYIQVEYHVGGAHGWNPTPGESYYSALRQIMNFEDEGGFRLLKGGVFKGSHNSDAWKDLQDIVELSLINRNWTPEGFVCRAE